MGLSVAGPPSEKTFVPDMRLLRMKSLVLLICALLLTLGVDEATSSPTESTTETGQGFIRPVARCTSGCYWNSRLGHCRYIPGEGRGRCWVCGWWLPQTDDGQLPIERTMSFFKCSKICIFEIELWPLKFVTHWEWRDVFLILFLQNRFFLNDGLMVWWFIKLGN